MSRPRDGPSDRRCRRTRALVGALLVPDEIDEEQPEALGDLDLDELRALPARRAGFDERLTVPHRTGLGVAMEQEPHGAPTLSSGRARVTKIDVSRLSLPSACGQAVIACSLELATDALRDGVPGAVGVQAHPRESGGKHFIRDP